VNFVSFVRNCFSYKDLKEHQDEKEMLFAMSENDVEQFHQLAREFWQWRADHQPSSSDDIPRLERPGNWQPDW
jgi:hypothetical protein